MSLAAIGPPAEEALPALLDALRDKEANVRGIAAFALARLGPAAVPALVSGLDHVDPGVRAGSALALGGMGAGARRTVDALLRTVHDEDAHVGLAAIMALGSIASSLQLQHELDELPALEKVLKTFQETKSPTP